MKIIWRRYNNAIHRDFGYFFFGLTLIYAISGIALNHKVMKDWNPEYIVKRMDILVNDSIVKGKADKNLILKILSGFNEEENYKNHYFPSDTELKIFLTDGVVVINPQTGKGILETSKKRPLFNQLDYFHYNPNRLWTWFADIYGVALAILAITGLFVLKGKNGLTRRGVWITLAGILLPVIFLIIFK